MRFSMDSNMQFPLVELSLNQGETVFIQRGSMVYHTPNVTLNTQLNASGSGLGRFVKAVGRSMVSGSPWGLVKEWLIPSMELGKFTSKGSILKPLQMFFAHT